MESGFYLRLARSEFTRALAACREHSGKKTVHDLRISARRMEALLHKVEEDFPDADLLHPPGNALAEGIKTIRAIRRLAGLVRDPDVHRTLLQNLKEEAMSKSSPGEMEELYRECDLLDQHFRQERKRFANKLRSRLAKDERRLEHDLEALAKSLKILNQKAPSPLTTAKRWVAREISRMEKPEEANLHEYRKRTKEARYLAELQQDSVTAQRLAQRLQKIQNLIGAWRDWELLIDNATAVLGKRACCLSGIKEKRDLALHNALQTVQRTR
jgi:CHAD domain-containing protein